MAQIHRRITSMAEGLYRVMPGAPPLPQDADGLTLWGEVDNDHWQFCVAIATLVHMAQHPISGDPWYGRDPADVKSKND